jgi:hypothetical protein
MLGQGAAQVSDRSPEPLGTVQKSSQASLARSAEQPSNPSTDEVVVYREVSRGLDMAADSTAPTLGCQEVIVLTLVQAELGR